MSNMELINNLDGLRDLLNNLYQKKIYGIFSKNDKILFELYKKEVERLEKINASRNISSRTRK